MAPTLILSSAPVRRYVLILGAVSFSMPILFAFILFSLFGSEFLDSPFVRSLLVLNVTTTGLAGVLVLYLWRRWVDIEAEPGRIRLPFRRHLERGGWRNLDEILFASQTPTDTDFAKASSVVKDKRVRTGAIANPLRAIQYWKVRGGVLVITIDEVLFVPRLAGVADKIVAHIEGSAPTGG